MLAYQNILSTFASRSTRCSVFWCYVSHTPAHQLEPRLRLQGPQYNSTYRFSTKAERPLMWRRFDICQFWLKLNVVAGCLGLEKNRFRVKRCTLEKKRFRIQCHTLLLFGSEICGLVAIEVFGAYAGRRLKYLRKQWNGLSDYNRWYKRKLQTYISRLAMSGINLNSENNEPQYISNVGLN